MLNFFWLGFLGKPQAKKSAVQTEFRRKGGGSGGIEQHFPYLGASLRRQREGFCWIYGLPLFAQNWILLGSPF